MFRYTLLGAVVLLANNAWAQQIPPAEATATSSPPVSTLAQKTVISMEEPLPGDRWVYELRDEITGTVTATRENVVTEVSPTEIAVRYRNLGSNNNTGLNIYDRSWNVIEDGPWRFSPNDGTGIRSPLAIGKTWPVQTNNINTNGNIWKRSGMSKVVGQESITTKAGTFDTFKIETTFSSKNVNNPTLKNEVTAVTWYAPAVDHWVKRTFVSRTNKHLQTSTLIELVEYGRKQ